MAQVCPFHFARKPALSFPNGRSPQLYLADADLTDASISRLKIAFIRD